MESTDQTVNKTVNGTSERAFSLPWTTAVVSSTRTCCKEKHATNMNIFSTRDPHLAKASWRCTITPDFIHTPRRASRPLPHSPAIPALPSSILHKTKRPINQLKPQPESISVVFCFAPHRVSQTNALVVLLTNTNQHWGLLRQTATNGQGEDNATMTTSVQRKNGHGRNLP